MSDKLKSLIVAIQDNDQYYDYVIKLLDYSEEELNELSKEIIRCVLSLSEGNMKNKNSMIRTLMNLYTSLHIVIMNRSLIGTSDNYQFRIENITGGLYYTYPREGIEHVEDVTDELLSAFSSSEIKEEPSHLEETQEIKEPSKARPIFEDLYYQSRNKKTDSSVDPTFKDAYYQPTSTKMDFFAEPPVYEEVLPRIPKTSYDNVPLTRDDFNEEDIKCIDTLLDNGRIKDFLYYNVMTNTMDYKSYLDNRPGVKRRQKTHNLVTAMEGRYKFFFRKDGTVNASHRIKKYEFCSVLEYLIGSQQFYLDRLEALVDRKYKLTKDGRAYEVSRCDLGGRVFITKEQLNFTKIFYEKLDRMVNWLIENIDEVTTKLDALIAMFRVNTPHTSRDPYQALAFAIRRQSIHSAMKLRVLEDNGLRVLLNTDSILQLVNYKCKGQEEELKILETYFQVELLGLYDKDYRRRAYNNLRLKLYRQFELLQCNMITFERFKFYVTQHSYDYYQRIMSMIKMFDISITEIKTLESYEDLNRLLATKLRNKFN